MEINDTIQVQCLLSVDIVCSNLFGFLCMRPEKFSLYLKIFAGLVDYHYAKEKGYMFVDYIS